MTPKLERILNRLLLAVIAASAIALAEHYAGPPALSLYFLAAVALGGLLVPVPTSRPEPTNDQDTRFRGRDHSDR